MELLELSEAEARKEGKLTAWRKAKKEQEKAEKIVFINSNKIYFGENAPISDLKSGIYSRDKINGMDCIKTQENKKVCSGLIEPTKIFENVNTGDEVIGLAYLKPYSDKWEEMTLPRQSIASNNELTNALARKGISITKETSGMVSKYIIDMIDQNRDILPKGKSINKLGWINNNFIPYDDDYFFDSAEDFREKFNSIQESGSYEKWYEEIKHSRKNNIVRLAMAASVGSVLLSKIGKQSFFVMIWGKTGTGKSVSQMIAASIWGNPSKGKYMTSFNDTSNYMENLSVFFNNLPVIIEELQVAEMKNIDFNQLIMRLCEEQKRGRLNSSGTAQGTGNWRTTFILSGEQPISNYNFGSGTYNRLIEIGSNDYIIDNGRGKHTVDTICENYGGFGKKIIKHIQKISNEELNERYQNRLKEVLNAENTEYKQAQNMATLLFTDDLIREFAFKEEKRIEVEDVTDFIFKSDEIDVTERAYDTIIDECMINKNKFCRISNTSDERNSVFGECWGNIYDYEIYIVKKALYNLFKKNNFNAEQVLTSWAEKGYVETFKSGKYTRYYTHTSNNKINATFVVIKVRKEKQDTIKKADNIKRADNENINEIFGTENEDYFMEV